MNKAISFRLHSELALKLDAIAEETNYTRSSIIRKALESYIEEYSDLQAALDRLHDGSDPVISGGEVRESLCVY